MAPANVLAETYFYPRPPRGGRLPLCAGCKTAKKFLSTPSARRATQNRAAREKADRNFIHALREEGDHFHGGLRGGAVIFIHALREEGDLNCLTQPSFTLRFYPRPPRGGRPDTTDKSKQRMEFLSTPSAREGDAIAEDDGEWEKISIHALREEGDSKKQRQNLYFLINYTTFCTNLEEP